VYQDHFRCKIIPNVCTFKRAQKNIWLNLRRSVPLSLFFTITADEGISMDLKFCVFVECRLNFCKSNWTGLNLSMMFSCFKSVV